MLNAFKMGLNRAKSEQGFHNKWLLKFHNARGKENVGRSDLGTQYLISCKRFKIAYQNSITFQRSLTSCKGFLWCPFSSWVQENIFAPTWKGCCSVPGFSIGYLCNLEKKTALNFISRCFCPLLITLFCSECKAIFYAMGISAFNIQHSASKAQTQKPWRYFLLSLWPLNSLLVLLS